MCLGRHWTTKFQLIMSRHPPFNQTWTFSGTELRVISLLASKNIQCLCIYVCSPTYSRLLSSNFSQCYVRLSCLTWKYVTIEATLCLQGFCNYDGAKEVVRWASIKTTKEEVDGSSKHFCSFPTWNEKTIVGMGIKFDISTVTSIWFLRGSRQPITSTITSWHNNHAACLLAHWCWWDEFLRYWKWVFNDKIFSVFDMVGAIKVKSKSDSQL